MTTPPPVLRHGLQGIYARVGIVYADGTRMVLDVLPSSISLEAGYGRGDDRVSLSGLVVRSEAVQHGAPFPDDARDSTVLAAEGIKLLSKDPT